jgi:hypothetical protein
MTLPGGYASSFCYVRFGQLESEKSDFISTDIYLSVGHYVQKGYPYTPNTPTGHSISNWGIRMKRATAPSPFAGSLLAETRHVVIGGILQGNPFHIPPEQFLGEFRQRRARRSASPTAA